MVLDYVRYVMFIYINYTLRHILYSSLFTVIYGSNEMKT